MKAASEAKLALSVITGILAFDAFMRRGQAILREKEHAARLARIEQGIRDIHDKLKSV